MRKYLATTIHIKPMQRFNIKLLSKISRVPQAELIRQGINMVLMKYGGAK